jgi:hypothetical protein
MVPIRRRRRMMKRTCPFAARSEEKLERIRQLISEVRSELDEYKYSDTAAAHRIGDPGLAPGGDPEVRARHLRHLQKLATRQKRAEAESPTVSRERLMTLKKRQGVRPLGVKGVTPVIHKSTGEPVVIRGRATY